MTWMDRVFVTLAVTFLILYSLLLLGCGAESPLGPSPRGQAAEMVVHHPAPGSFSASTPDPQPSTGVVDRTHPRPRPAHPLTRVPVR